MAPAVRRIPSPRGRGLAGLGLALALAACAPSEPPPARVVLLTIDTLRADHVGVLGGGVPTPHLDRLAAEGVLLTQATTPVPTTGPAHASLFTGLHPWRHGTLRNGVALDAGPPTVAELARRAGIPTAAFVSSYVLHERFGFDRGFETYVFEPTEDYQWDHKPHDDFYTRGEHTVAAASEWLADHHAGPFFLWVHLFDPHRPYDPPAEYAVAPDEPVDLTHRRYPGGTAHDLAGVIRAYRGEVRYADAQTGVLVDRLRALGILDQTLLVVTSDHGEGLGDHRVLEHGINVFDELVRVPLILRGPGLPAGRRLDGPAQLEDLAPTLMAALGLTPPDALDGHDLGPWLRGEVAESPRRHTVGRRRPYAGRPDLFYVRRYPEKWLGVPGERGRVYDLADDPRELGGADGAGAPEALAEALAGQGAPGAVPGSVDPDPEVRRALEALGYLEE